MPKEIPIPWTEAHEQALADYIRFAYEEARRNQNEEPFLPEEQEAYDEAMRRVDELGVFERPEATIKLKALDLRLSRLQHSGAPPSPRKAEDLENSEGQPTEGRKPKAIRGVPRAGNVPRELPVEPLPSAAIEAAEGTPAAAAEGEETSGAADRREAPPAGTTTTDTETPGEKPEPTPAPRRPRRWEKDFAELTAPPKTPEEQAALERALSDLKDLSADKQALLEKEAEIFLSNNEIPVTPDNRARLIREASLLILRRYPGWSRERVFNPPPESETVPLPAEQRRGKREYPANTPEVQAEIEAFLKGLTAEQSARLQNEIRALAGRTADRNEQAARDHVVRYYSLNAIRKIAGPEAPPVPEPEPPPAPEEQPVAPPHDEKLAAATERLKQLTPEERSWLDAEAEIYAQNRRWELTDGNREQARLRILADYSDESLDRTLHPTAPEPESEPVPPPARNGKRREKPIPMGREEKEAAFARFAQQQAKTAAASTEYRPRKPEPAAEAISPDEDEIQRMLEDARKSEADLTREEAIQRLLSRPDFYPTTGPIRAKRLAREEALAQEDEIRRLIAANPDMSAFAPEEAHAQAIRLLENSPDEFPNDGGLTRTQRQQAVREREWALLGYEKPKATTPEAPPAIPNIEETEDAATRAAAAEVAATVAADEAAATEAAQEAAGRQETLREAEPPAQGIEAEQTAGLEERMRQLAGKISESRQQAGALLEAYPHLQPSREAPAARREKPKFGRVARGLLTHLGAATAKTAGSLLGVKILYDLPVWWRQKRTVKKERREVQAALTEMSKTIRAERRLAEERTVQYQPDSLAYTEAVAPTVKRFKDSLEQAQHLSVQEKKEFRKRLARIMAERQKADQELREEDLGRADKLSRLYLNTKISGYQVAREALNSALVLAGMPVLRGAAYAATAAAERWSRAGREYEKATWGVEHSASFRGKRIAQARDLFLTSMAETFHGLTGGVLLSKETKERRTGLQRTGEFFQAASKLAIAYGIGGAALNALLERPPTEIIEGLMKQFEEKGVGGMAQETLGKVRAGISEQGAAGVAEAAAHNWWQNFNDMTERFTALRFDRTSFAASQVDEPMPVPSEFGHVPKLEDEVAIRPPSEAASVAPTGEFEHVPKLEDEATVPISEAARALLPENATAGVAVPAKQLLEKMSQLPMATIEQGGNVWQTAKTLVAEGKISAEDFARAWEHSVKDLPDLVHRGDVVKFVPGVGDEPPRFEVVPESGLPTGTARDLANVYESLGKKTPAWLQQKIEAAPSLDQRISLIPNTAPGEFREALGGVTAVFNAKDLATQEQALGNLQELREHLEYQWRAAHGDEARLADIAEDMAKLDATRQQFVGSIEFLKQSRAFDELLRSVEVPSAQQPLLEKLTVTELLERKDTNALRGLKPLAELVERYIKLTPRYEHPREQIVATFLKKFIVGGKIIEPPTAV